MVHNSCSHRFRTSSCQERSYSRPSCAEGFPWSATNAVLITHSMLICHLPFSQRLMFKLSMDMTQHHDFTTPFDPQEITQAKVNRTKYVEYVTTNLGSFFVFSRVRKEDEKRDQESMICAWCLYRAKSRRLVKTLSSNSHCQIPVSSFSIPPKKMSIPTGSRSRME